MKPSIRCVLVKTMYPTNIGASARALANMGGEQLILVAPQCELNSQARRGAAGAQEPLQNCVKYSSWEEFNLTEPAGLRVGLSKRKGRARNNLPLTEKLNESWIAQPELFLRPIYLIFGPEDDGLSSEDLTHTHWTCSLPIYGSFSSVNLSHAVLLASYIVQEFFTGKAQVSQDLQAPSGSQPVPAPFPDQVLRQWLSLVGFNLDSPRVTAHTKLREWLLKSAPDEDQLRLLESILRQNIRKLAKQAEL